MSWRELHPPKDREGRIRKAKKLRMYDSVGAILVSTFFLVLLEPGWVCTEIPSAGS